MSHGIHRFYLWFALCLLGIQIANTTVSAQTPSPSTSTWGGQALTSTYSVSVNTTTRIVSVTVASTWTTTSMYRPISWVSTLPDNRNASDNVVSAPTSAGSNTVTRTFGPYPVGGTIRINFGTYYYETFGDNTKRDVKQGFMIFPTALTSQTITVTPATATINKGGVYQFTVSGQHTGLVYSESGVTINPPYWEKTFDQIGIHSFTIYAEEDSTYSKSNTVTVTVTVRGYRVRVPLAANTGDYIVMYDVIQGGVVIESLVQLKGALARSQIVEVPAGTPVTIKPRVIGVSKDGALWSRDAGAETELAPTIVTPVSVVSETDEVPVADVPNPEAPSIANPKDSEKSVWERAEESDLGAKDKTVKEAADKTVAKLDAINTTLKAGITVQVSNSGGDNDDSNAAAITAAAATGAASTSGGQGIGSAAAASNVQAAFNSGHAVPAFTVPNGSASGLSVTGFGLTLNLDPLADSSVAALAEFSRGVITFFVSALLIWWAWGEFKNVVEVLIHSQQAKGNSVIGGTGAQATALIAAAAITAILIGVPAAYWAFASTTAQVLPAGSGPLAISFYLLRAFLPVEFLISAVATAFLIRKAGVVLVAATSTLIRFIVP